MRTLARQLGCALITVSQAYEMLAARRRVVSRVGLGTFVALPPAPTQAAFARKWEPDLGRVARAERMEGILDQNLMISGQVQVAAKLNPPGIGSKLARQPRCRVRHVARRAANTAPQPPKRDTSKS